MPKLEQTLKQLRDKKEKDKASKSLEEKLSRLSSDSKEVGDSVSTVLSSIAAISVQISSVVKQIQDKLYSPDDVAKRVPKVDLTPLIQIMARQTELLIDISNKEPQITDLTPLMRRIESIEMPTIPDFPKMHKPISFDVKVERNMGKITGAVVTPIYEKD